MPVAVNVLDPEPALVVVVVTVALTVTVCTPVKVHEPRITDVTSLVSVGLYGLVLVTVAVTVAVPDWKSVVVLVVVARVAGVHDAQ